MDVTHNIVQRRVSNFKINLPTANKSNKQALLVTNMFKESII